MDKKLSILLVEDDETACKAIERYIDCLDDVSLIGVANSSNKALEYVKTFLPEAVILDLELHKGGGSGLLFLTELKQLNLPYCPFILITTNNTSPVIYEYAHQSGADFIMDKHQSDYSERKAVDFLRMMKNTIFSKIAAVRPEHNTSESPEQKAKRITRRISTELECVGVSHKHIGFKYLTDAIQLVINDSTGRLCAVIGGRYGKSEASVERAMQNAIDKAWRSSDIEDLLKFYTARINPEKGKPTILEFVCFYANKIKNEY